MGRVSRNKETAVPASAGLSVWLLVLLLSLLGGQACSDDDNGNGSCAGIDNACEQAGATNCNGETLQTCRDNGQGCLVWTDTRTCGEHATCAGGICQCTDRCIPGEHQCVGDMLQGCIQDADGCAFWSDEQDCSQDGGTCEDRNGASCVGGQGLCGNAVIDNGETCDGTALGGATCETQGYDGGDLRCNSTCDGYDESGCITTDCGNGLIDNGETCDGTALGGETCVSQGYYPGRLACNATCDGYDFSTCGGRCGDRVINGSEVCDGTDLGGATCATEGFDGGDLACNGSCDALVTSGCFNVPPAGDCAHARDITAETFPLSLTGTFGDDPSSGFSCASSPTNVVWFQYQAPESGEYGIGVTNGTAGTAGSGLAVFDGTSCNPYGTELVCNQAGGKDMAAHVSLTAGSTYLIAFFTDSDDSSMENPSISISRSFAVGWCNLQWPLDSTLAEGSLQTTYGRVYIAGVTDQTSGPDAMAQVIMQVGVGPDGSNPSQDPAGWTWYDAVPNSGFVDNSNDEYMGDLPVPPASGSPYDFAFRVSGDSGITWMYCDGSGNTPSDAYDPSSAGNLVSTEAPRIIISEYVEGSSSNKALEFFNPTGTAVDLSACQVKRYNNGNAAPCATYTFPTVTLDAGALYVVCNSNAGSALQPHCDELNSNPTGFNGDDALEVYCNGILVDSFGQVGYDPGSAWGTSPTVTANATLRRKAGLNDGDRDSSDAFDPSIEWDGFSQDTFDGLGTR